MTAVRIERQIIVRRGKWLTWATLGYNCIEALLSVGAGVMAGSIAIVGFGVDSAIEVSASLAGLWRLHADIDPIARARVERATVRIIGLTFLALATYVTYDALTALILREVPRESVIG